MYRFFSFIVIFSFVSVMLYFHNQNGHYKTANNHLDTEHQPIMIPKSVKAPSLQASVFQDPTGGWLLKLETKNFTFTPEKVGSCDIRYNEGHAHLYINEKKINRIYGPYYNISELHSGVNTIKVTLNGNNHSVLSYNGKEIAYTETINIQ